MPQGLRLHFDEHDWERVMGAWNAWWAHDLDRPLVMVEVWDFPSSDVYLNAPDFTSNLPLEMPADEVIDRYQVRLEHTLYFGDAFPKWWPNYGPGVVAAFLGANVTYDWDTVWFSPGQEKPITAEQPCHDENNPWWQRVKDLTRTAADRWGGNVSVGYTDLGGNLDIIASLRSSQKLLIELVDEPEEVARLVGEITRLWLRYYDELSAIIQPRSRGTSPWAPIWSPGRCYMMQSDLSYMISPRMFERYVLPDLQACCAAMQHRFYHLDGKGEIAHLDHLLGLKELDGIQWIPGDGAPPPEEWLPLLKRIIDGGKLCQLYVSPQGARTIVRELGGKGFALFVGPLSGRDEAEGLLEELLPGG